MGQATVTIREVCAVEGTAFEVKRGRYIYIGPRGVIEEIGEKPIPADIVIDGRGLIAIPAFVNAHAHIEDAIAKDAGLGLPFEQLVLPPDGLKHRILRSAPDDELIRGMREALMYMAYAGIAAVADYRTSGLRGVELGEKAFSNLDVRVITFGRFTRNVPFTEEELRENRAKLPKDVRAEIVEILKRADGFCLSSVNDVTDPALEEIYEVTEAMGKLRSVHAAESEGYVRVSLSRTGKSDVERAVECLKPHFLVHMTHACPSDIKLVAEKGIPVVCCPRANGLLGNGFPPLREMLEAGVLIALGTDNVFLNSPDMFREMEYVFKAAKAFYKDTTFLDPKMVLRMATINGARALGLDEELGTIEEGKKGSLVLLDMRSLNLWPMRDPISSIVNRATVADIRYVILEGRIVRSPEGLAYPSPSA